MANFQENFTTKKVQAQDLGEYLCACRSAAGLSVSETAAFSGVQNELTLEKLVRS